MSSALNRNEILDILQMPESVFYRDVVPLSQRIAHESFSNHLLVTSMVGYSNICKNNCVYCGMRASKNPIERYRIPPEQVIEKCLKAKNQGFECTFLISGEDPKYGFENILSIVSRLKKENMWISLACGEFSRSQFEELKSAGVDEYVLKFEMSNSEHFNQLNPSTTFNKRMQAIYDVKSLGLNLSSGNIVDWPGQTLKELADDILLMHELDVSWAPVIPYLPAKNTPLAVSGHRGDLLKLYKEIAILRILMPRVNITAQQPGKDITKGLSDVKGNLAAIEAGANVLFFDLLSDVEAKHFRVIDDRNITGPSHIFKLAEVSGKELILCR